MLTIRRSTDRGHADHGWLKSRHSFSFAGYFDPAWTGWGKLLVINEDRIAPGTGFGTHGHRDMEIISYVIAGELAHRDSMGNGAVIRPGEVQRMSAGTGVRHSEYNHAEGRETYFFQIWIEPDTPGVEPGYAQRHYGDDVKRGRLCPVAARDGRDGALPIHADATLYAGLFDGAESARLTLDPARKGYVHLVRGRVQVNGEQLEAGDAALLAGEAEIVITAGEDAEVLVFDLAP